MITLSLVVLECFNPFFLGGNNLDQNPRLIWSSILSSFLSSCFRLWKKKSMDLLLVSTSSPLTLRKILTGDEYDEEIYEVEEEEEEEYASLGREEEGLLFVNWESLSLRQMEQTPADWLCFVCRLQAAALDLPRGFWLWLLLFGFQVSMCVCVSVCVDYVFVLVKIMRVFV